MDDVVAWSASWAWSLPLIVINVTFHVLGLGFIHTKSMQILSIVRDHRHFLRPESGPAPSECLAHSPTTSRRFCIPSAH
jgi:hypothetical protein